MAIAIVFVAIFWQFYGEYNRFLLRFYGDFRAKKKYILLRLCGDKKHFSGIIRQYILDENNQFFFSIIIESVA